MKKVRGLKICRAVQYLVQVAEMGSNLTSLFIYVVWVTQKNFEKLDLLHTFSCGTFLLFSHQVPYELIRNLVVRTGGCV